MGGELQGAVNNYGTSRHQAANGIALVEATREDAKWQEMRARDGFQVIASAPDVELSAEERVRLYRSKDKIEKDFQTIKSVLELRPVRHRTDAKVRAHVTLCVLALAVQRWMQQRLLQSGRTESAERALEELHNIRLCELQLADSKDVILTPNAASPERQAIAKALGVDWALRAETLGARLAKVRG